jgi:hypothetical protein
MGQWVVEVLSDDDLVVYSQRNQPLFLQQSWFCEGANAESMPTKASSSFDSLIPHFESHV